MKKPLKAALALACALALIIGTAVATNAVTTKTLLAQYMGIKISVNGQIVTAKDANGNVIEPFVVDGTTYLPVRAVGEALGKEVTWDGDTNTVIIGSTPMAEDAKQLVAYIESAHPAFVLDKVPEGYEAAKAEFLAAAADQNTTLLEFTLAAMSYTASLKDGHTRIDPFGNSAQPVLQVGWVADGERLYLMDNQGAVSKTEVTAVGGVPVPELFAAVDRIVPAENRSASSRNHAQWLRFASILDVLGCSFEKDGGVALALLEDGRASTRTFPTEVPSGDGQGSQEPIISTKAMGDVFYVDMNVCQPGTETDAAAAAMRKALADGTTKFIIDVRGNGGGNSQACNQLLEAIGMEAPHYGAYVRFSELALDANQPYARGYTQTEGGERGDPDLSAAKQNPDVKLVVLTDEDTYSSATMLGVFVRDGGLGTIIGRASANAPNSYGDILYYTLENTNITGTVSHKQWLRPDQSAQGDALIPDIETKVGEDALQAALKFLA